MKVKKPIPVREPRYYHGREVTLPIIRRYARKIAEQFHPDKIILFGSHAYGTPHDDSDVDLLVVIEARNQLDKSIEISWKLPAAFPDDLLVYTPKNLERRLRLGDSFLTEVVTLGKVLYEKPDEGMDRESRKRPHTGGKGK